ncbi:putative quinol monooxygenase [Streptomyces sp. YH02]|uniref:putative quinol monooxygenase n=1 Tax=Streptomyces sp. YH02 TaxID=3256999 RepID=UPI0037578083
MAPSPSTVSCAPGRSTRTRSDAPSPPSWNRPTRQEPGNLQHHLHEHEDGRFFLHEVWRSQEDLEGYFDTMLDPYPEAEPAALGPVAQRREVAALGVR